MRRVVLLIVPVLLSLPAIAGAQSMTHGDYTVHWNGGGPRANLRPTIPQPPEMSAQDRELWDAVVFNAYDRPAEDSFGNPVEERSTEVASRTAATSFGLCIESADESYTGQRLATSGYHDPNWWRREVEHFTGYRWDGALTVEDVCDPTWSTSSPFRILVREATRGEAAEFTARTFSVRGVIAVIIWHPDHARTVSDAVFDSVLIHELGHALGLWHAPFGSGFVMAQGGLPSARPEKERWLTQMAFEVGPDVGYPGVIPDGYDLPDGYKADREVLEALYGATDGLNWIESRNWNSDELLGYWHGVTTDFAGRVRKLDLTGNNVTGPIPAELGGLQQLQRLELQGNNLSGPIPADLGKLSDLEVLGVGGNNLTGPIPAELGGLPTLRILTLPGNNLTGRIPADLGKLSNLVWLVLGSNNLTGPIPAELGMLSNLQLIDLDGNNLSGRVPAELGQLSMLGSLILNDNNLTGPLPSSLTNLQQLQHLHIHNNAGLCAPVDEAFQAWLTTVPEFRGDTCGAADEQDPADRAALMALYEATNGKNWKNSTNWGTDERFASWHGVTTDYAARVVSLHLYSNNLTGPIPTELDRLSNLRVLHLYSNNLTGPLPPEVGNLSNLWSLFLEGNNLTGPLPSSLTDLQQLQRLHIDNNAGLCAPADEAFQAWLATVPEFLGATCGAAPVPALPLIGQWLLGLGLTAAGARLMRRRQRHDRRAHRP